MVPIRFRPLNRTADANRTTDAHDAARSATPDELHPDATDVYAECTGHEAAAPSADILLGEAYYEGHGPDKPAAVTLGGVPLRLAAAERLHVQGALRQANGNKVQAAKALGVSRRALYRLIAKHRLEGQAPRHTPDDA